MICFLEIYEELQVELKMVHVDLATMPTQNWLIKQQAAALIILQSVVTECNLV